MEIKKYTEKSKTWWENAEKNFDEWISEKYKYCLYYSLLEISEQCADGNFNEPKFIYPCIVDIITRKNNFSEETKYRSIEAKSLFNAFKLYCSFVSEINKYVFFLPSKQTFCSFINVPVRIFNQMQSTNNEDLISVIDTINDYFTANMAYAGQSGAAKSSIVSLMLKAEDAGQGIMTAKESKTTQFIEKRKSIEEISRKLKEITGE